MAAELVERAAREFPLVAALPDRQRLRIAASAFGTYSPLLPCRRPDLSDVNVLAAGRVNVDLWVNTMLDADAEACSVCHRLSGVGSFYRYAAAHDLVAGNPTTGVERPEVDPDHTATVGLDRDQAGAMVAAADADRGVHRCAPRWLLLHNALRVDEVCAAGLADLGIVGKSNPKAKITPTPGTLEAYLAERAARAGIPVEALTGPLLATRTGGRMNQGHLWELVRQLARTAGVTAWKDLSPHSLRHSTVTFALDAGVALRDVQDYARHRDPRTTRRYDRSRASLDRSAAYTVASYLA